MDQKPKTGQVLPLASADAVDEGKVAAVVIHPSSKPQIKSTNFAHIFMLDTSTGWIPKHFFPPANYTFESHHIHREYHLNFIQRIFVAIERPKSVVGLVISLAMNAAIIIGCIVYVLGSDARFMHAPEHCHEPAGMKFFCGANSVNDPHSVNGDHSVHALSATHGDVSGNATVYSFNDPAHWKKFMDSPSYSSKTCKSHMICAPHPLLVLEDIESVILILFTVEYLLRFFICWFMPTRFLGLIHEDGEIEQQHLFGEELGHEDKELPMWSKGLQYLSQYKCMIDLATIIPFYIFMDEGFAGGAGFSKIIRVIRLTRLLHLFKLSKDNEILHLLERTMKVSLPAMMLVSFVSGIGMLLFGSIIHFFEGGTFMLTDDFPDGAFIRVNMWGEHEVSPFVNMQAALYYVLCTATNTGYGDLVATTTWGRIFTCVVMMLGIVMAGLPIGVLGSNFAHEYEVMHAKYREKIGIDNSSSAKLITDLLDASRKGNPSTADVGPAQGAHMHPKSIYSDERLRDDEEFSECFASGDEEESHTKCKGSSKCTSKKRRTENSNKYSVEATDSKHDQLMKLIVGLESEYTSTMAILSGKLESISEKHKLVRKAVAELTEGKN